MKKYTADFETCTWLKDETYVWAWAICEIGSEKIEIGNNIGSFMEFCENSNNSVFYFHNLKFDGEFIIWWALNNGYKHIKEKTEIEDNTFSTLISDLGQFYQITIYFKKGNKKVKKVTFYDSLKIIPFSVEQIAKSFNLEISKLSIDYNLFREKNHILTKEEEDYIKNDVLIIAKALNVIFSEKLTKMTQGSNALSDYKNIINQMKFKRLFPELGFDVDKEIRKAYKGGFTYLNPIYKNKDVENVVNLDVNSLYPFCMRYKSMPVGMPEFYVGKYKNDVIFPLYIQMITCSFELKENKIPTIQIKGNNLYYKENEYLTSSNNQIVSLTLTNIDLDLFFEHYYVYDLEFICGYKFRSISGIFNEYIDKWTEKKVKATIEKNAGQRTLSKLMLNSLYGKFATSLETKSKYPYLGDDNIVHYSFSEKEKKKGLYIPIGAFITSYARELTIKSCQKVTDYSLKKYGKDLFIYADTDSCKTLLPIEDLEQIFEIDDVKLGAWKNEGIAEKRKIHKTKMLYRKN